MWGIPYLRNFPHLAIRFIPTHVGNTPVEGIEHEQNSGSSPRMWGIRMPGTRLRSSARFIPTHVGNTNAPANFNTTVTVHPHACGEYTSSGVIVSSHSGSSPRMWGILLRAGMVQKSVRFIPTHVGNTEYQTAINAPVTGSSPRMWGIPLRTGPGEVIGRFIPTHVGNRPFPGRLKGPNSVHPHACGEYEARAPAMIPAIGSSPRMWGIHRDSARLPRSHPVHPHACGEYWTVPGDTVFSPGSSPRMWGIHHSGLRGPDGQRFIPTHVGNTFNLLLLHV